MSTYVHVLMKADIKFYDVDMFILLYYPVLCLTLSVLKSNIAFYLLIKVVFPWG